MALEAYPSTDIAHGSPKNKWTLHLRINKFLDSGASTQLRVQARKLLDVYEDLADAVTLEASAPLWYLTQRMGTTSKRTVLDAQDQLHKLGVGDLQRGRRGRPRTSGRGAPKVTKFTFRLDRQWGPHRGSEPTPRGEFKRVRKGSVPPRDEKGQFARAVSSNEFEKVASGRTHKPSSNVFEKVATGTKGKEAYSYSKHTEVTKVHQGQHALAVDRPIPARTKTPLDWLNEHLGDSGATMPYDPAHPRKDWHKLVNVEKAAAAAGYTRGELSVAKMQLRVLTCPFDGEPEDAAVKLP